MDFEHFPVAKSEGLRETRLCRALGWKVREEGEASRTGGGGGDEGNARWLGFEGF